MIEDAILSMWTRRLRQKMAPAERQTCTSETLRWHVSCHHQLSALGPRRRRTSPPLPPIRAGPQWRLSRRSNGNLWQDIWPAVMGCGRPQSWIINGKDARCLANQVPRQDGASANARFLAETLLQASVQQSEHFPSVIGAHTPSAHELAGWSEVPVRN
jgi:hypothetical protein